MASAKQSNFQHNLLASGKNVFQMIIRFTVRDRAITTERKNLDKFFFEKTMVGTGRKPLNCG